VILRILLNSSLVIWITPKFKAPTPIHLRFFCSLILEDSSKILRITETQDTVENWTEKEHFLE